MVKAVLVNFTVNGGFVGIDFSFKLSFVISNSFVGVIIQTIDSFDVCFGLNAGCVSSNLAFVLSDGRFVFINSIINSIDVLNCFFDVFAILSDIRFVFIKATVVSVEFWHKILNKILF